MVIPKDPTFRALACAAILIALWFAYGPTPQIQPPRVTNLRFEWKHCADVVLVGDSTVAWPLQPEVIEDELGGGYRVVNFGFVAVTLTYQAYLAAAEEVLDPSASHRAVVIAVNFSNSRRAAVVRGNSFKRERGLLDQALRDGRKPSTELDWHDELDVRLKPRGLCWFLWKLCPWGGQLGLGYNGQLKTTQYPVDETRLVPAIVDQNRAPAPLYDQASLDATLLQWIKGLRAHGVDVIAYVESDRPAIAPLNEAAGYDRSKLARQLRDAGASVIDYPSDLTTVNGVHLDPSSAVRWSHELGKGIAAHLPARPAASTERCPWPLQSSDRK